MARSRPGRARAAPGPGIDDHPVRRLVLTAFSAWQSTLWNGEQAQAYARASSARTRSNAALITASNQKNYDATSFANGIVEFFRGDQAAVEFFRQRLFRDPRDAF